MSIKETSEIGSAVIRSKAKAVKSIRTKKVGRIVKDLKDSMRKHGLVGMAAPQIGIGLRIFVTEIRKTPYRKTAELDQFRVFINPRIVNRGGKLVYGYEGCGSVANGGLFGPVKRSSSVIVEAWNERGDRFCHKASSLLARVIQHEMDHLDGVVFIDRVTDTKKLLGRGEYLKMAKKKR